MEMNFTGKTVMMTGAASGMALLSAQNFADLGANVVMIDINETAVREKAAEIEAAHPGHVLALTCDVRDYARVEACAKAAYDAFGSIDVMLNLAGGAEYRMLNVSYELDFPDCPIEVFDWSIDVNLKGQLYFDHAVMKYMRDQKSGVVINIGSITGQEGCDHNVGYSTAKSGAMNGLTKSLALYGAQHGIRVVCVSPGPVLTRPGMAGMKTPMGRAADPQELVDAFIFLASDHSGFTTGINILIDGGRDIARDKT